LVVAVGTVGRDRPARKVILILNRLPYRRTSGLGHTFSPIEPSYRAIKINEKYQKTIDDLNDPDKIKQLQRDIDNQRQRLEHIDKEMMRRQRGPSDSPVPWFWLPKFPVDFLPFVVPKWLMPHRNDPMNPDVA
jgi:hypothetical protein